MADRPLASVIINNFNYGRFLRDAVDSALAQDYPATEVIVVDDGSTDDSRDVIAGYGDRVRAVFKDNGGQGSAYNAGVPVSRGEYICMLDADDTLYPGAIRKAVEAAVGDSTAVKVQWPLHVTDAAGRPTGEWSTKRVPPEGDLTQLIMQEGPLYDFDLHTGALYSRSFVDRILPVPETPYRNGADVYLTSTAPVLGKIRNLHEPLGTYRAHGNNNYRGRTLDDARLRNYVERFEANAAAVYRFFRETGRTVDPEQWKRRNFNYVWPTRLLRARADLAALVPPGDSLILIDDNEWGGGDVLPGRRVYPFLERDGEYWGPPMDDETAIRELQRLQAAGGSLVAFWWTAFWWLDHYPGFARWLSSRYRPLLQGDHLIAFDLKSSVVA